MDTYSADMRYVGTVNTGDSMKPRHLVVHPFKRMLFWTDRQGQTLYRARLDGDNRITMIDHLNNVTAITIDYQNDLVFIAHGKRIDSIDINGQNK